MSELKIVNLINKRKRINQEINDEIRILNKQCIIPASSNINLKELIIKQLEFSDWNGNGDYFSSFSVVKQKYFPYKYGSISNKFIRHKLKETSDFKRASIYMSCSSYFGFYCLLDTKTNKLYADISSRNYSQYVELTNNEFIKKFLFWIGKHSECHGRNMAYQYMEQLFIDFIIPQKRNEKIYKYIKNYFAKRELALSCVHDWIWKPHKYQVS